MGRKSKRPPVIVSFAKKTRPDAMKDDVTVFNAEYSRYLKLADEALATKSKPIPRSRHEAKTRLAKPSELNQERRMTDRRSVSKLSDDPE
ncbi:MAG: hypothetical protein ABIP12_06920 [Terriglobales bacterium]